MKERHSLKSEAGRREPRAHFLKTHYVQPGSCVCERVCSFQTMKTELEASSVYSLLAFICSVIFHLRLDFPPPSASHESYTNKQRNLTGLPGLASSPLRVTPRSLRLSAAMREPSAHQHKQGCSANAITLAQTDACSAACPVPRDRACSLFTWNCGVT